MSIRSLGSSRTYLPRSTDALRASLLLSLGLTPLACGGTVTGTPDGGAGSGAGGATSYSGAPSDGGTGSTAQGGAPARAGASFGGAPHGGAPHGGAPHGGASFGGTTSVGGAPPVCLDPVQNPVTHLVRCSSGLVHRPQAFSCQRADVGQGGEGGSAGSSELGDAGAGGIPNICESNAQCASLHLGYCDLEASFYGGVSSCKSGCEQDADCGSGICICDGVTPGRCVDAGCRTDADCGPKSWCLATGDLCGIPEFQCVTARDECLMNADCGDGTCNYREGARRCDDDVCGRPFLVAECERVAAIAPRGDWSASALAVDVSGLSPTQRAALAAHWARLGQLEHASIAAFARFNLQLLSLGAPASLIEACNQAQADETAHAMQCFAFASQYGGTKVGPGKLEVGDCFEDSSLAGIARLVLREGCIGETVASLEALEAAELAQDPAVKRALQRIAQDERAHAELAFKFLSWVLTQSSPEARAELAREATRCVARFERAVLDRATRLPEEPALADHGQLSGETLRAVHISAIDEVVRPLLSAMLGEAALDGC